MSDIDIDHLRTWIGREALVRETLSADLVRRFRAVFDLPEGSTDAGHPAPSMIHFCLAPDVAATAALGPDGHPPRGGFLPPVPLPRRMWAGGEIDYRRDLRIGDVIERRSRIGEVSLKQGSMGPLCFVAVHHDYADAHGIAIRERHDIVYRGETTAPAAPPIKAPPETPPGEHVSAIHLTPVHLFRYSALTFNGHRIHYDRPYAMAVEGYGGLVVHGPLQATLLFHYAATLRGTPSRFRYRGVAPALDTEALSLNVSKAATGLSLWTARAPGHICMTATAEWNNA